MARNLDPKCKQCRREGEKLFLKGDRCYTAKCALVKRNYPPGIHGVKGKPRLTEYGKQLREKQKARKMYNLLETPFKNYFKKAVAQRGNTAEILWRFLELRLDNVIYRLGLATSRILAQQMVNHGFFTVNDKKVDIPSFQLRVGDVIKIKDTKQDRKIFEGLTERMQKKDMPSWLSFDLASLTARLTSLPAIEGPRQNVDMKLIVEFYSR